MSAHFILLRVGNIFFQNKYINGRELGGGGVWGEREREGLKLSLSCEQNTVNLPVTISSVTGTSITLYLSQLSRSYYIFSPPISYVGNS